MIEARTYNSSLRREQAEGTRERILAALAALLEAEGTLEGVTNKAVARQAGVTEITVYRHFPSRDDLLRALWDWMNRRAGAQAGRPQHEADLVANIGPLFAGFEAAPGHILATLTTPQGREMRASLDAERRRAFLDALADASAQLPEADKAKAAAVLQLLYSAYSWVSLREQWGLRGEPAAQAVAWAAETLIHDLKTRGSAPLAPAASQSDNAKDPS
jgi:AcrR family transcriptional regulator